MPNIPFSFSPRLEHDPSVSTFSVMKQAIAAAPDSQNLFVLAEQMQQRLNAILTQLVECETGLMGLAQLLESGTEHAVSTDGLFHLILPLLTRQQEANNHLSELI